MIRIRTAAAAVAIVAGAGFLVAGPYLAYRGFDAKAQVRAELLAQKITTPEDAAIPNARVDDAATAQAQADVIEKHMLTATGGKTYAELDREDPLRQVASQGSLLRGALLSSVLAWNVANLVIGLGALVSALGVVTLLVGLALRTPAQLVFAAPAERKQTITV